LDVAIDQHGIARQVRHENGGFSACAIGVVIEIASAGVVDQAIRSIMELRVGPMKTLKSKLRLRVGKSTVKSPCASRDFGYSPVT
jgi:hypothetical protein